ncbi:MAG TPA: MarR family winged helix-turn-helix transcriptional regulator [Gemmatimonadales bacterium]|jgi:DNA-binding MarR family transcriptional regulator
MSPSADRRALDALRRLVRALVDSAHQLDQRAKITPAQRFVLQQLVDGPVPTVNALAARTHTTQATVSTVLDRLEARGLIVRQRDPRDRRRISVALSATGRRLLARSTVPVQSHLARALETMPPSTVRALATSLEAWIRAAGLGAVPAGLFLEPDGDRRRGGRRHA